MVCLLHFRAESSNIIQSQANAREICGSIKCSVTGRSPRNSVFLSLNVFAKSPTRQLHTFRRRTDFQQSVIFRKSTSIVERHGMAIVRGASVFFSETVNVKVKM